ncbi:MAG: dihydrofolate reductase family protein, partial [Nitrososphaeraceae archaeon]
RIVRGVEEIRAMKQQPGKDMLTFGGATLISSLMNLDLIDEVRLMINPSSYVEERGFSKM